MNKEEAIKKINESDSADFQVFTATEHTTYLDNFKKTEVEAEIGERISKVHNQYDNDLFELTGKRKEATEKTYDFMKRQFGELKAEAGKLTDYQKKIGELEEALRKNAGDPILKQQLDQAKTDYADLKRQMDELKTSHEEEKKQMQINSIMDSALASLKFRQDISEEIRNITVSAVKAELVKMAETVDGKTVFKQDGKILTNKDKNLEPFTASELLTQKLDTLLDKGKPPITIRKPTFTKDKDGKMKSDIMIPAEGFKTRADVSKYLSETGLVRGTEEYSTAYAELVEGLPELK